MSDTTPGGFPPPSDAQTNAAEPDSQASSGLSGKAKAGLGVAGLCAAAVVGGGAYAYSELSGGGLQPADVLPASSDVALRIDLDPSAGQKIEVVRLLNKFPSLKSQLGLDDADTSDLRERAFETVLADECSEVDYKKDVEPWIGDRLGAAGELDTEQFVVALQIKDETKARDGMKKLADCGGGFAFSFYEGYAIISDEQKNVDDSIDETKKDTLADSERYSNRMDQLGEAGLVSAWLNLEAMAEFAGEKSPDLPPASIDQLAQVGDAAMALRADGSALEFASVSNEIDGVTSSDGGPVLGDLPTDTIFAATVPGIDSELVGSQWDDMLSELAQSMTGTKGVGGDPEQSISSFESESGLSLPEDLQTLLSGGLSFSIGKKNLDQIASISGPDGATQLDIALRAYSKDSTDILTKLSSWLDKYQVKTTVEETDSGAALATNADAAKAALEGGDLSSKDLETVIANADEAQATYYLDVAAALSAIEDNGGGNIIPDDLDSIRAAGYSFGNADGVAKMSLRVGFKE